MYTVCVGDQKAPASALRSSQGKKAAATQACLHKRLQQVAHLAEEAAAIFLIHGYDFYGHA
jgi:hypothetical protein